MKCREGGFTLLEFGVVAVILGIVAAILLNRFAFYQEMAEKANMEYMANTLKTALIIERGVQLAGGREDPGLLGQKNPFDWLEKKPANYLGVFRNPDIRTLATGNWFYDESSRELVYLVRNGEYFRQTGPGQKRVRYHIKLLRADGGDAALMPMVGVRLELVEPYTWRMESK